MPRWGQRGALYTHNFHLASQIKIQSRKNASWGKAALRLLVLVSHPGLHSNHVATPQPFFRWHYGDVTGPCYMLLLNCFGTSPYLLYIPWDIFPAQNQNVQNLTFILGRISAPVLTANGTDNRRIAISTWTVGIFFSFFKIISCIHGKKKIKMPLSHSFPLCLNSSLYKQLLFISFLYKFLLYSCTSLHTHTYIK